MPFEPIAIVGSSCTLPGALSPEALWANVLAQKSALAAVPAGRWELPPHRALATAEQRADRTWTDIGGYVEGFEPRFDAQPSFVPAEELSGLDPVFQWVVHGAREALRPLGHAGRSSRAGLILGNLSFPTAQMARYAWSVWLDGQGPGFLNGMARERAGVVRPPALNRFMSGLPAQLAARALGLDAGAVALDAACASSLYAIKLACDWLHDRKADVMVAGAVNAADTLFIHIGFCALSALSRSGQSRPFHRDADGLVPAEGAAFVVLKRLEDAVLAKDRILGVVRGVGLSNDGRGRGLLVPAREGQVRAMRLAYQAAGLLPRDISVVECHATGTPVGDATELLSMADVFADVEELHIGSIKSNLGHLITTAGMAGLIKLLGALQAGLLPPTRPVSEPLEALRGSPFRLITEPHPWVSNRPRRAALSAFGFGGNNAHLILEEWCEQLRAPRVRPLEIAAGTTPATAHAEIAVVGLCARVGDDRDTDDFTARLFSSSPPGGTTSVLRSPLEGVRFPPSDLALALPQQLLVMDAARRAVEGLALSRERTGVFIGMGTDPSVSRYGARWQLGAWAESWARDLGVPLSEEWLSEARAVASPELAAAGVLGTMPNIVANRINSQLDLAGASLTVSAEELSGVSALGFALRALRAGELDAVLVGAVDLADDIVHRTALAELGVQRLTADGAVVLVLKRLADAERAGERVLARLGGAGPLAPGQPEPLAEPRVRLGDAAGHLDLLAARGQCHAASGLLQVATAVLAVEHGALPQADGRAAPWFGPRVVEVATRALGGELATLSVSGENTPRPLRTQPPPRFEIFSGRDRADVLAALEDDRCSAAGCGAGPARLVIVSRSWDEASSRRRAARCFLRDGGPVPEGVAFRERPIEGELAFVFGGAGAAYPGMGRDLLLALPAVREPFARAGVMQRAAEWMRGASPKPGPPKPMHQLWASCLLSQHHAEVSQRVLGLAPQAVLGYSSGESNALFAMRAWRDLETMIGDVASSPIFDREIAGELSSVERAWRPLGWQGPIDWRCFAVSAGPERVKAALQGEPFVHLTIINSPEECVLAGDAAGCSRVLAKLAARAVPIEYRLAAHCPELEYVRREWFQLHRRTTWEVPGVRFYWNADGEPRAPSADGVAQAITQAAMQTLDFPRLIERAYRDGVRCFLEHGAGGHVSGWIARVLGSRDHLAIPMDVSHRSSLDQICTAAAWLAAAGFPVQLDALARQLFRSSGEDAEGPSLRVAAHAAEFRLPAMPGDVERMVEAPPIERTPIERAPPNAPPERAPEARPAQPVPASGNGGPARSELPRPEPPGSEPPQPEPYPQAARSAGPFSILSAQAAHRRQVSLVHQDFLKLQAEAQQRFLELHQQLQRDVLARSSVSLAQRVDAHWPSLTANSGSAWAAAPLALDGALDGLSGGANGATRRARAVQPSGPAPAAPTRAVPEARPLAGFPRGLPGAQPLRPGPKFSRAELSIHASGKISSIFGPSFEGQDEFVRQVRMPEPPLLLADRVTGIEGAPGTMGTGTIWTETDVAEGAWYLHAGRMPAGVLIEAGQADLMLISWLGVDRLNRGERVYRLLGCELTYHAALPAPGDLLQYEIHIDGHAIQGETRLFFFHYDCWRNGELLLSVRHGQAGFFSDAELASSAGVLWDANDVAPASSDAPVRRTGACSKASFGENEVRAFSEGRVSACFGPGFELAETHVRSPRLASGRLLLLHRVTHLQPDGGPWGRGYLRAQLPISPNDWFFEGHFKNDPCMPGTLMFEGCLQAMSFYLTALGHTLARDGWRFEPSPDNRSKMRCRGQVTPAAQLLVYEVFVRELRDGEFPELEADLLCSVDGLKAFHAETFRLRLVPDWPLEEWKYQPAGALARGRGAAFEQRPLGGLRGYVEPRKVATHDGFEFGFASLLACAWGRPSTAFGPFYARFDGPRRVARLPGPPYHFVSRVLAAEAEMGVFRSGSAVEVEYDVPAASWYFDDNGTATMPLCVVMEAALQPCGWLASYIGSTLSSDVDLMFRNLDGVATLEREVLPSAGPLKTRARITNISRSAGLIIESFEVQCFVGDQRVFDMKTVFGFFPKEAFENQSGLPVSERELARIQEPSSYRLDLRERPARYFSTQPALAGGMLCMLDRITAYDARGGERGLGWVRAEKDVDPSEWFFKAHFFQDPVQPGSLGIEAFCQLLQFAMIEGGMADGLTNPRFEPIALGRPLTWKYRGQVVPSNRRITTEVEITHVGTDGAGVYAIADAYLWVDGKRIYHAKGLSACLRPERVDAEPASVEEVLDPAVDTWLLDHCPTWTLPALPLMSMLDRIAGCARRISGLDVLGLSDVQVHRWLPFPGGPVRLRSEAEGTDRADQLRVTLSAWRTAKSAALSRFEPVATGIVHVGTSWARAPEPWAPLESAELVSAPYESGTLFHGPSFQIARDVRWSERGASALLDIGLDRVPPGTLRQGLLDAMTHAIPHAALHLWSPQISEDWVAYPYRAAHLRLFAPLPGQGVGRVEIRFAGFDGDVRRPMMDVQLIVENEVCADLRLVEILLPKGPIGAAAPGLRRAFLRDRAFVPGLALSRAEGARTELSATSVQQSDWLPGNVARIYDVPSEAPLQEQVAAKDHVAQRSSAHPATVVVAADLTSAATEMRPLRRYPIRVTREADSVVVTDAGPSRLDLSLVRQFWRSQLSIGPWLVEDIQCALVEQFVADVVLASPRAFRELSGKSVLYLSNHQVGIESLMFSVLIPALSGAVTMTLAKAEHKNSWLGNLIRHSLSYPGVRDPKMIAFFDREDKSALLGIAREIAGEMSRDNKSAMIHIHGTRALGAREPVFKVSASIIDLAVAIDCPVVPVRFVGGLPVDPLTERLEFPVGYGRQEIWIGHPITARELRGLPIKERKQRILDAINALGTASSEEVPSPPDRPFAERVDAWVAETGAARNDAVVLAALQSATSADASLTRRLLEGAEQGRLVLGDRPEERWLAPLAAEWFGPRGPRIEHDH